MTKRTKTVKCVFTLLSLLLLVSLTTNEVIETSQKLIIKQEQIEKEKILKVLSKDSIQCFTLDREFIDVQLFDECLAILKKIKYLKPTGIFEQIYNTTYRFVVCLKTNDEFFSYHVELGKIRGEIPESIPNDIEPKQLLSLLKLRHEQLISDLN